MTCNRVGNAMKDERGQIIPLAVVIMVVGLIVVAALFHYIGASLLVSRKAQDRFDANYVAEAGIGNATANLLEGEGMIYPDGYSFWADVDDDGFNDAHVTVTTGPYSTYNDYPAELQPQEPDLYFDPGVAFGLQDLGIGNQTYWYFPVRLPAGGEIEVNWTFFEQSLDDSSDRCQWSISLYEGRYEGGGGGSLIDEAHGTADRNNRQAHFIYADPDSGDPLDGGVYTVEFWFFNWVNDNDVDSLPFNPYGGDEYSWVRVQGYQDYLITSEAWHNGELIATVTSFVRQTPGPSKWWEPQQVVSILSWRTEH